MYTDVVFRRLRGLSTCDGFPLPDELVLTDDQQEALAFLTKVCMRQRAAVLFCFKKKSWRFWGCIVLASAWYRGTAKPFVGLDCVF